MKRSTIFAIAVSLASLSSPVCAQDTSPSPQDSAAASQPVAPKVGDIVYDKAGEQIGTVKSVAGQNVVVSTASGSATLPIASLAAGTNGLTLAMTKAEFEAALQAARKGHAGN